MTTGTSHRNPARFLEPSSVINFSERIVGHPACQIRPLISTTAVTLPLIPIDPGGLKPPGYETGPAKRVLPSVVTPLPS
jgi:hypothetical protein